MTRLYAADQGAGEISEVVPGMELDGLVWDRSHPLARLESLEHAHPGFTPRGIGVAGYSEHGKRFPGTRLQVISDGRKFRLVTRQSRTGFEREAHRRHPVVMMHELDGVTHVPLVNVLGVFRMLVDEGTFTRIDEATGWLGDALLERGITVHERPFEDEGWGCDAWIKDAADTTRKAMFVW